MQIHELNERKVRQQNRAKAGIASQLIKKANANSQAKLTQQAQQAAPTSTPAVSSTNVVSGGPTPAEQEKLNARIAAATAAQPTAQPAQQPEPAAEPAQAAQAANPFGQMAASLQSPPAPAGPVATSTGGTSVRTATGTRNTASAANPNQPAQPAQQAATPSRWDKLKAVGKAAGAAAVDSTRGKWDPAYAYGAPGRPAAAQPATPAPDMSTELAKLGITDRQVAGIGKILQQANNLNTRLTRTGDPAVDKFLQAMGYNVR